MHTSLSLPKFIIFGALSAACFMAPASAATVQPRTFYQNASASCHGASPNDEKKLVRAEQRLRNNSGIASAEVVCSLQTDALAVQDANFGTVDYAIVWMRRFVNRPDNKQMNCTLVTSFADDPNGVSFPGSTDPITPLPLSGPGAAQGYIEWDKSINIDAGGQKFLAPVNIRCTMPPKTELNDWLVLYSEDVGS